MRRALMALAAMAAVLSLTGCGSDEEAVSPYDKAPVPAVPDRTQALPAADAPLPAGQYWATATGVDGSAMFHGDQHPEHVGDTLAKFLLGRLAKPKPE